MTSLDTCGFEKLITICHGDAKPNNFLFRNINIEFDDLDLGEDLDCEGTVYIRTVSSWKASVVCFAELV
jgi:thiamine kinase-like enzyme